MLGVAETKVNPGGNRSVTWTPVAFDGPVFVAVTVKSTLEPTVTEPLLAIFATPTSAREVTVVTSDAESLARLTSPPPDTDAVLVRGLAADWVTATTIVIVG